MCVSNFRVIGGKQSDFAVQIMKHLYEYPEIYVQ